MAPCDRHQAARRLPTMLLPKHYAPILKQIGKVPRHFTPSDLGLVTECFWDGVAVDAIQINTTSRGILEFEACPPTASSMMKESADWTPQSVVIKTDRNFLLVAQHGFVGLQKLHAPLSGGGPAEVLSKCHMAGWTALKDNANPCLWVAWANISKTPRWLKDVSGNLELDGFEGFSPRGHWIFKARYTTLLLRHEEGWVICIDSGSQEPPGDDLKPELRLIGYLQGHPLHLTVMHRISSDGEITGLSHMMTGHAGEPAPLGGSPTPFLKPLFRIDFFNRVMRALKARPELTKLLLVPTGHHFEGHGRIFESMFVHAWMALESFVSLGRLHGLIQKEMPKLADPAVWKQWVDAHAEEIKSFATQGNEASFLNIVRDFTTEKSKVRAAFNSLGIAWTPEMDVLGGLRGEYVHEGTPREYEAGATQQQIALLRTMLAALYARLFGYEGPISDYGRALHSPDWWPDSARDPDAEAVILQAV